MNKNVNLRELEFADLGKLNTWRNDPSLISNLGTNFTYISEEIDKRWYEDYLINRHKAVRLAVEVDGVYVGILNLTNINLINRSAEFSIFIGDPGYRGKGVGYIASSKIIAHGQKNLGLQRIWLTVLSSNAPAISMYEKLGFEREGTLRKALYKESAYHDLIMMSLIS
jgi:UDP-4-amino-4,6-dideoxy-N-acetyl-beta-L-altrosamine N-acetyltransferase